MLKHIPRFADPKSRNVARVLKRRERLSKPQIYRALANRRWIDVRGKM
jgi:hypothetical protein